MCQHSPPTKQYEQARIVSESCFIKDHHREGFHLKKLRLELEKKASLFSHPSSTWHLFPFGPGPAQLGLCLPFPAWHADTPRGNIDSRPPFLISSPGGATVVSGYPERSPGTSTFLPHPFGTPLFSHLVVSDALKGNMAWPSMGPHPHPPPHPSEAESSTTFVSCTEDSICSTLPML